MIDIFKTDKSSFAKIEFQECYVEDYLGAREIFIFEGQIVNELLMFPWGLLVIMGSQCLQSLYPGRFKCFKIHQI